MQLSWLTFVFIMILMILGGFIAYTFDLIPHGSETTIYTDFHPEDFYNTTQIDYLLSFYTNTTEERIYEILGYYNITEITALLSVLSFNNHTHTINNFTYALVDFGYTSIHTAGVTDYSFLHNLTFTPIFVSSQFYWDNSTGNTWSGYISRIVANSTYISFIKRISYNGGNDCFAKIMFLCIGTETPLTFGEDEP